MGLSRSTEIREYVIYGRPHGIKGSIEIELGRIYDNSAYLAKETAILTGIATRYTITKVKRSKEVDE